MKPRLLDLFCGAGGAAEGYARAGFEVVGVDIKPQPHYPFTFHQQEAIDLMGYLLAGDTWAFGHAIGGFDAIHASPPCQAFSVSTNFRPENRTKYPDLVAPTRKLLQESGLPYVIENVPGAPLENPIQICGTGLGMKLRRHRLFECNFPTMGVACAHGQNAFNPEYGASTNRKQRSVVCLGEWRVPFDLQKEASGIDWMTLEELSEAIPPAYTEHIGGYLLSHLQAVQKAAA